MREAVELWGRQPARTKSWTRTWMGPEGGCLPWLPLGVHGPPRAGGTGPAVVLIHGWAGRAADWRHLAADLIGAGWRVVVPDLPGHGMTPGRRTDLFELGRAVSVVPDHERPTAVVTHSMGFPATMRALEDGAASPATLVAEAS